MACMTGIDSAPSRATVPAARETSATRTLSRGSSFRTVSAIGFFFSDALGSLKASLLRQGYNSAAEPEQGALDLHRLRRAVLQVSEVQQQPGQHRSQQSADDGDGRIAPVGPALAGNRQQPMHQARTQIARGVDGVARGPAQREA